MTHSITVLLASVSVHFEQQKGKWSLCHKSRLMIGTFSVHPMILEKLVFQTFLPN